MESWVEFVERVLSALAYGGSRLHAPGVWMGFNVGIKIRVVGCLNYETPNRYVLENARIISTTLDLSNLSPPPPAQPCWQRLRQKPTASILEAP